MTKKLLVEPLLFFAYVH